MIIEKINADIVSSVIDNMHKEASGEIDGVRSGIDPLDEIMGYFHNGGLYVLMGRPGMGKTEVAINMVAQMAVENKTVFYAMTDPSINRDYFVRRLLRMMAGVDPWYLSMMSASEKKKIEDATEILADSSVILGELSRGEICDADSFQSYRYMFGNTIKTTPDIIIIDDFEHIDFSRELEKDRWDLCMKKLASSLKRLAIDMNRPVLILANASSGCEMKADKHPTLADMSCESLSYDFLSYEADCVLSLYRESYYFIDEPTTEIEISVLTNQYGFEGRVKMDKLKGMNKYVEVEEY